MFSKKLPNDYNYNYMVSIAQMFNKTGFSHRYRVTKWHTLFFTERYNRVETETPFLGPISIKYLNRYLHDRHSCHEPDQNNLLASSHNNLTKHFCFDFYFFVANTQLFIYLDIFGIELLIQRKALYCAFITSVKRAQLDPLIGRISDKKKSTGWC